MMSEIECEKIQLAIMAGIDSEASLVSVERIGFHLNACDGCRKQMEEMKTTDQLFERQERLEQDADLWPGIQNQIVVRRHSKTSWQPFLVVSLLLVAYKLFEMLSHEPPAFAFKLLPLAILIGLFVAIRENPFKVNSELILEK